MIRLFIVLAIFMAFMAFMEKVPQETWDNLFAPDCNCTPGNMEYDYIIDLKQDEIFIYRDDGREFVVPHDSLDEFIINDNI